ncbi:DUF317 domain-containing protein [Kitasatospora sp. NPDC047058]|uniref:DUF317 domain-containing protein n=1 Tax=Kitasatospora sp. NPDC047058 TaxID=3155620 RepID=UPI0033D75AA3
MISAPVVRGPRPGNAIAHRSWPLGEGNPNAISSFLYEHGWSWVIDAEGGLHAASPCTQVYVGYQPDNRHVDTWIIALTGTARQPGWRATFNRHAPAELVIDLLAALVSRSTPRPSTTTSSTS